MAAQRTFRAGFTLLELVVAIAILAIVVPLAYEGYLGLKQRSYSAQLKSGTLAGLASLNAQVSLVVRNAYGVDYAATKTESDGSDEIALWADKQERHRLRLFMERDKASDVSRLMAQYDGGVPQPLHSNLLYVTRLDFTVSPDPRAFPARADDQPWVGLSVEARSRSPLSRETDGAQLAAYQKSKEALTGRWTIRNFSPTSLKR